MSNISNTTWQALTKNLFPDLTYRNNSGGEPKDITNLTHDYLKGFIRSFITLPMRLTSHGVMLTQKKFKNLLMIN